MKNKCFGTPSAGFVSAHLRRYMNQRASWPLVVDERWRKLLEDGPFDVGRPITVSAIFAGVWKRPKDWPNFFATGPVEFVFRFRDVVLRQDDREAWMLYRTREQNKRNEWEFKAEELGGLDGVTEAARTLIHGLPHAGPGAV